MKYQKKIYYNTFGYVFSNKDIEEDAKNAFGEFERERIFFEIY